jgi:hypothetical protein
LIEQPKGKSGIAMSTIEEVRAAEKKLHEVLEALKKAGAQDPNDLSTELKKATDDYGLCRPQDAQFCRTGLSPAPASIVAASAVSGSAKGILGDG